MPVDRRPLLGLGAPLLWTAYVVAPIDGWGLLDGFPIRPLEAAVLAAVWWVWGSGGRLPGRAWAPLVLILLKLSGALWLVPQGFDARYYANASWAPPQERSLAQPSGPFTRRDARLAFGQGPRGELPLHFFHDNSRFNVGTTAERQGLPFSIEWTGQWRVYDPGPVPFFPAGESLAATVLVDGVVVLEKPADAPDATATAPVAAGWRALTVRVSAPRGLARAFEAGVVETDGTRRPFGTGDVFSAAVDLAARERDAQVRLASRGLDLMAIVALAAGLLMALTPRVRAVAIPLWHRLRLSPSGADVLAIACLVALIDAWWFGWQIHGRVVLLLGGDDMLTYATLARDIVLNGWLMNGGQPPGTGEPFYYQPLYPYILAATHAVFGEDMYGIHLLQRLCLWITLLATWRIGTHLFGARAGAATLGVAALFIAVALRPWAGVLLGEVVFIAFVCLAVWALVVLAQGGGTRAALAAGLAGGFATLSRSTLLPAWGLALPLVALARHRRAWPVAPVAAVLVLLVCVVGLATARNWVVSGRFVPIASSFAVNFELGNPPPPGVAAHDPRTHALTSWLPLDERTMRVLEGAWHAPGAFVSQLGRKALYTLGVFEPFLPGRGWSPLLVTTWILACGGLLVAGRARPPVEWLVPATLALTHFAAVTLIFPHAHGDRLILPFYVLLLPYVGVAVAAVRLPRYD